MFFQKNDSSEKSSDSGLSSLDLLQKTSQLSHVQQTDQHVGHVSNGNTKPKKELRYVIGRGLALTRAYEISNAQTITRMRIRR